ncbi:MAG: PIN domain-containing protein [Methylacidiphilales bacterium]|nr:PIN domain-containing protein [Candidatus Methylacidiphilales bacterium]
MIHLDANFLIGALRRDSPAVVHLENWFRQGESLATSSIAWAEFLNGPVRPDQIEHLEYLIQGNIIAFGRREAEISSRLINQTGRKRGMQPDCFIAATAICARARLATLNQRHFAPFASLGLQMA